MKAQIVGAFTKIFAVATAFIPRFSRAHATAAWVFLSILFLPITRAADLSSGGNHDGAISIAGESDTWTFTAITGDTLLLRIATLTSSNTFTAQMRLYGPNGVLLDTTSTGFSVDELAITAADTGLYTVIVADDNNFNNTLIGTGQYRIRFAKLPGAIPILDDGGLFASGGNQDGLIHTGDLDFWTFTAADGDRIVLRLATLTTTNSFNAQMRIYGPNGVLLDTSATGQPVDEFALTAADTGLYTVVIADDNNFNNTFNGSGQYRIRFAKLPGAIPIIDDGGLLESGGNQDGLILTGDLDFWTFPATAGDRILLRLATLTTTNSFNAQMRLYGPNGVLLDTTFTGFSVDELALTAADTGLYTVVIADDNNFDNSLIGTGQYRIRFAQLPGSIPILDDGGLLESGGNQDGLIIRGDLDFWTFPATTGDRILLRLATLTTTNSFNAQMRIYGPNGVLLDTSATAQPVDEFALTAADTGLYTVVIADDNNFDNTLIGTGQYRIRFAKLPGSIPILDDGGLLESGGNQDGLIIRGDLDFWTFPAVAGERVLLRLATLTSTNTFTAQMRLYGPNGVLLDTTSTGFSVDEFALTAADTGLYTVVVADDNNFDNTLIGTGQYRIRFAKLPGAIPILDDGGLLESGGNQDGLILRGDLDFWTFPAVAGERVLLRLATLTSTNTFTAQMRLYGPNGVLLDTTSTGFSVDELAIIAADTGLYTVVIADDNNFDNTLIGTGQYRIRFAKLPGAIPILDDGGPLASGGNQDGLILTGDLDFWTFPANAGDRILLRIATLTGTNTFTAQMRLYGPNGVLLDATSTGFSVDEFAMTASDTGLYTVVIADDNNFNNTLIGTGQYRIRFANLRGGNTPSLGDEGGSLTNAVRLAGAISLGDLDLWTFNACEGDTITLQLDEVGATSFNPQVRLYNRDGLLINSSVHQSAIQYSLVIPLSGTYRIVVTDGTASGTATGSYQISATGISTGITFCDPELSGTHTFLTVIGGVSTQNSILLSTTNVALPSSLWTPALTNQFDTFGVVNYTLPYNTNESIRAFQTRHP